MRKKIIDRLSDAEFNAINSKYLESDIRIQKGTGRNSWYYFIPPELVINEAPEWRVFKSITNLDDNVISGRLIYKALIRCCEITDWQFYDLMFLRIQYEDQRPTCAQCGKPLSFNYLMGGYGHHASVDQSQLFCSMNCSTRYFDKNKITGFSRSNSKIFELKGLINDQCYLYIAHTSNYVKYGVTKNPELRLGMDARMGREPYLDLEVVYQSNRIMIARFEEFIRESFDGEEFLDPSRESELREFIDAHKSEFIPKRILIISVHADDEILAFGGYMIDQIKSGAEVHVRFGTIGGVHILQDHDIRMSEAKSVMDALGVSSWDVYFHGKDAEMDLISQREIATMIDRDLDEIRPDEVFCCYPSVHQDHIAMYNAFMISMRLRDGFMPPFVALGEYPFILTSKTLPEGGSFYHPLSDDTLKRKIELFEMYKTQLRPAPSPLGSRGIEVLAQTRGIECGHKYAEKFYLQKLVR